MTSTLPADDGGLRKLRWSSFQDSQLLLLAGSSKYPCQSIKLIGIISVKEDFDNVSQKRV